MLAFREDECVGHLLLEAAETLAKEQSLIGLSLEAQNDNLIACRFYVKEGFVLGRVDTLKQSSNPNIDLTLHWYKIFNFVELFPIKLRVAKK